MAFTCSQSVLSSSGLVLPSTFSLKSRATVSVRLPASRRALVVRAEAAPSTVNPEGVAPSPIRPDGPAMADFLVTFSRTLNHAPGNGKSVAAAGRTVLSRVRIGLDEQQWGADMQTNLQRQLRLSEAERLLLEIEKDLVNIAVDGNLTSNTVSAQLLRMHCAQAAKLLGQL
eukprot:TRINITY_DN7201_c0_g1_i2.p1 TRINITY_DN7201_c0_g1~~TRINITY_DN7201_c0_g1_i2.p1  ORF type:complete len:171 (-),score=1.41 TRINITY_DN7201_c0_g1_i2:139-651(-)